MPLPRVTMPLIINHSGLCGWHLRRAIVACLKARGASYEKIFIVLPGEDNDSADGEAVEGYRSASGDFVEGPIIWIFVDKPLDTRRIFEVIEHEIDHCLGRTHAEMVPDQERKLEWTSGLELRWQQGSEPSLGPSLRKHSSRGGKSGESKNSSISPNIVSCPKIPPGMT